MQNFKQKIGLLIVIGRLIEDGIFLGRVIYFYTKSADSTRRVGYSPTGGTEPSRKERVKWAWANALGRQ